MQSDGFSIVLSCIETNKNSPDQTREKGDFIKRIFGILPAVFLQRLQDTDVPARQ